MTCALTSAGGNPLLEQGGAGLQSSAKAFEHLLPLALVLLRNSGPAKVTPASSLKPPASRTYSRLRKNRNRRNLFKTNEGDQF